MKLFLLILVMIPFLSCRGTREQRAGGYTANDSLLYGTWYRSYEAENMANDGSQVWRNTRDYTFPPSRGREGMTFLSENKCTFIGIAPADGPDEQPGRWGWTSKNQLRLTLENGRQIQIKVMKLEPGLLIGKTEE